MTRKILFSVLMIAAVMIAAAGITFAVFSDNAPSDLQQFDAGTVDIKVDGFDEYFSTDLDMETMEAGDCSYDQVTVTNNGSLAVNLWNWIYLWGDLIGCDPNSSCNFNVQKTLVSGSDSDGIPEHIEVNGSETYDLEACLPLCAGNNCQGKAGSMRLFFHAVQDSNLDGFTCTKLEDKDAPDWVPDPTTPPHGNVCYKAEGSDLRIIVNAYGLTPGANFQLALDGGDMNDPNDGACTTQDDYLAGMSGDLYESGYWNWGTYLEPICDDTNGGEGVYNYAGVNSAVTADAGGSISYDATISGLPSYDYVVKANVKEVTGALPGTSWTGVLSGLDYLRFTIP